MLRLQAERPRSESRRPAGLARTVLLNIIVLVFLLVLAEGLLSTVLLSSDVLNDEMHPQTVHTRYDPELGWVGMENLDIPNMYGPGVFLRTNSQGFRGSHDYSEQVPPGRRRVICSGDSVTFGYGVNDRDAWCRLLETIDSRLETINMGQPGYGVDQAYLWYKRDAARFRHHVHLFAPITDDFRRIQSPTFLGYDRPVFVLEDGRLVLTNVPVPTGSFYWPRLTKLRQHLWSLRSAEAVRRLKRTLSGSQEPDGDMAGRLQRQTDRLAANEQAAAVVAELLLDLKALNEARGSVLVVVYLPTYSDRGRDTAFWVGVVAAQCQAHGIPFVNLVEEFDRMSDIEAARLYLPDLGHLNPEGNAYIARLVYDKLAGLPEISRVLLAPNGSGTEAQPRVR